MPTASMTTTVGSFLNQWLPFRLDKKSNPKYCLECAIAIELKQTFTT